MRHWSYIDPPKGYSRTIHQMLANTHEQSQLRYQRIRITFASANILPIDEGRFCEFHASDEMVSLQPHWVTIAALGLCRGSFRMSTTMMKSIVLHTVNGQWTGTGTDLNSSAMSQQHPRERRRGDHSVFPSNCDPMKPPIAPVRFEPR